MMSEVLFNATVTVIINLGQFFGTEFLSEMTLSSIYRSIPRQTKLSHNKSDKHTGSFLTRLSKGYQLL